MKFLIFLSEAMVLPTVSYIAGFGLLSGRPMLDGFVNGAKNGIETITGTLPTLVGLLVSVGALRASGFLDFLGELLQMSAALLHTPPQIMPTIPACLVSDSVATGLVLDTFKEYGTDSSLGLIMSVPMSNTETMLYCLSVCSGSVDVIRIRYTLARGLITTAVGVAVSVMLAGAIR